MISCSPRGARRDRWKPPVELSNKEQLIMKRLNQYPLAHPGSRRPHSTGRRGRSTHLDQGRRDAARPREPLEPGETVHFDPEVCGACPLRASCTQAASGKGRSISIARDEAQQKKFRKLQETSSGRAIYRQRVAVEHCLAHIAARKGASARYIGVRKNLFDLRRASAIQNLEEVHRMDRTAA